jgi:hypothetical protein
MLVPIHTIEQFLESSLRTAEISGKPIGLILLVNESRSIDNRFILNYSTDRESKALRATILDHSLEKVGEVEVYAPQLFREPERGF